MQPAKIISATDRNSGETVYLTACDAWSADITFAELLAEEDTEWRLAFAGRLPEVENARIVETFANEYGLPQPAAA